MPSESAALIQTNSSVLPPGTVVGRKYRVDEVIAEGGMGIVYKGWHLVLEHPIAIKVVRPEYANHPEAAWRFVNEARASARLQGTHSAHVLDLGRIENGPPVMILEYLEGYDLRQLLATHGPLPLARAIDYVLQICEAMAEAHVSGIIHRDLKPENLFVARLPDGTETLKVIDFGISKRIGASERSYTQQSLGSPDYMSPEQMSTPDQVDPRADIWSIGVVLYELLTNTVPFRAETLQATCVKVMCEEPVGLRVFRPDVPPEVESAIYKCLRKSIDERYRNIKELLEDLLPFASPEYAQSSGRVRHILGEAGSPAAQSESGIRLLSCYSPRTSDLTPLPPASAIVIDEPELKVPMQPLWPLTLAAAAVALIAALTISGPTSIGRVAASAVEHVEVAARSGARTISDMATSAATYLDAKTDGSRAAAPSPPLEDAGRTTQSEIAESSQRRDSHGGQTSSTTSLPTSSQGAPSALDPKVESRDVKRASQPPRKTSSYGARPTGARPSPARVVEPAVLPQSTSDVAVAAQPSSTISPGTEAPPDPSVLPDTSEAVPGPTTIEAERQNQPVAPKEEQ